MAVRRISAADAAACVSIWNANQPILHAFYPAMLPMTAAQFSTAFITNPAHLTWVSTDASGIRGIMSVAAGLTYQGHPAEEMFLWLVRLAPVAGVVQRFRQSMRELFIAWASDALARSVPWVMGRYPRAASAIAHALLTDSGLAEHESSTPKWRSYVTTPAQLLAAFQSVVP